VSDLAVIVPSRGRPQNIADLMTAWEDNANGYAALIVAVDDDDPALPDYLDLGLPSNEPDMRLLILPKPGSMVAALNSAALPFSGHHVGVGFMGDDHRPRTVGWDEKVVAALTELGTGIVSGPDGFRRDQLPTWCAMTSDIVRTLGYMAPPSLHHMYVDNAWQTLGTALGKYRYLPDVLVEHMHPLAGKSADDEGYQRVNSAGVYARDEAAYVAWVRDDLPGAVERIRFGAAVTP
jgi:hypothetical protein